MIIVRFETRNVLETLHYVTVILDEKKSQGTTLLFLLANGSNYR